MIGFIIFTFIGIILIIYSSCSNKKEYHFIGLGIILCVLLLLFNNGYQDYKEQAPYYEFPDKFCEYYEMNYKKINNYWSSNEYICISIENDILVKRRIDNNGVRWAWEDTLDMEEGK